MSPENEIECPSCGKIINAHLDKCPNCCSELKFHDFDDLEMVANGHHLDEKECVPVKEGPSKKKVAQRPEKEPQSANDELKDNNNKGFFGKIFGQGKK